MVWETEPESISISFDAAGGTLNTAMGESYGFKDGSISVYKGYTDVEPAKTIISTMVVVWCRLAVSSGRYTDFDSASRQGNPLL